jgi:hypothetical protein
MSEGRDYKRNREAWELAGRQHGVVARRQLLALGFNSREIEHRVARRRLHPLMRGVYAVGWPKLTPKRCWMAAVLACGEGALLSHRSAAALWGIGTEKRDSIDVSVTRRAELKRQGLRVRGRPSLTTERITTHDGIPITTPVQTLIDLSTELTSIRLSDSDLEVLFRPIAAAAGLLPRSPNRWSTTRVRINLTIPLGGRRRVDVRLGACVAKQIKDAGSPNSSAIRTTEDAEMRRATRVPRRADTRWRPPKKKRHPCIRRRRRASRHRPRRSRRWRRAPRGSGAAGCPRRGRRHAGTRAWPRPPPGRATP